MQHVSLSLSFFTLFMLLVWNCRGSSSAKFRAICKSLVFAHNPLTVVLIELWVSETIADKVISKLGFKLNLREEAIGFSAGIWILWSNPKINISLLYSCRQLIHVSINYDNVSCLFTVIYRSPVPLLRSTLWQTLRLLKPQTDNPWLLAGDFIAMLRQSDKRGGSVLTTSVTRDFNNCVYDCELLKLEVRGPYFTWERSGVVERIAWVFCNDS